MIAVTVNGEARQLAEGTTVEALIGQLKISRSRLAVERNLEIVPRTEYAETILQEGDSLEIVGLVGGG